jgi:hypothetical protein
MESTLERNYGPAVGWKATEKNQPRPAALHVILHKREYVFPWSRFVYTEGSNGEVIISFPTHEVLVSGYGLDHLLADLAAQRVVSLHEPYRADKFRAANEPAPKGAINELVVREINDEA